MEFTVIQEQQKEKLLDILREYDVLDYDQYKQSILNKDDEPLDYWLCDDDKCAELSIKNLREKLPKYTRLYVERSSNDSDHDSFEICQICGKFLNKYLTWYEDSLDDLIEYCKTKEDVIEEYNAFKIVGLLQSTGWLHDSLNSEKAKNKLIMFIEKTLSLFE